MSLAFGARPGPYDVVSPRGECGLGEVYRGGGSTLSHDVAITLLPVGGDDPPTIIARAVIRRHNARPCRERRGLR
jgi:hypothetical protein